MGRRPKNRENVPWRKRQEIPDPQILDAANQYEDARKLMAQLPPGSGMLLPLINSAAIAVELFLKCLSAELIEVEDEKLPGISRVFAAPAIISGQGHNLRALLKAIPQDITHSLLNAFDTEFGASWNKDLQSVLEDLEGAFQASRYPFEHGIDITRYNLDHLMKLAEFLDRFTKSLSPSDRIEWK